VEIDQRVAEMTLAEVKKDMAIFAYKPSPTQQRFHDSNSLNRLVTAGGRGGKTTSCLVELSLLLLGLHPTKPWFGPITVVCLCLSRQQASMTVQKKLFQSSEILGDCRDKPMIPEAEIAEYGSVKHGFRFYYDATLKNGSKIHFAWADDEATWKRIQGMQADVVYIDENAGSERLIIELRKRLMDAQSDPSRPWAGMLIWGATGTIVNPTFEKFRDYCIAQYPDHVAFIIPPGETGVISKDAIARLSATLTKEQRAIHIDGTATSADLVRIYGKQWDDKRHVLSKDYEPEPTDNIIIGYDPGVEHPTGIMICAIRRDQPRRLIMVKYFDHARQTVDYDVECIRSFLLGRRMRAFVYDYKAKERQKHTKSLIMTIMEKFKEASIEPIDNQYIPADKRHYQGIQTVRDYLDPDHYDKNVPAKFVVNPSFDSGGTLVRQQLLAYRGKEGTKFTGPGGVIKKDDEACDTLRYLCRYYPEWSARYQCGHITLKTESPLLTRTEALEVQAVPQDDSIFARQCRMSKQRTPAMRAKELGKFGMSTVNRRIFI
jgi:hypothetical protein